jgi:hypothetical protein
MKPGLTDTSAVPVAGIRRNGSRQAPIFCAGLLPLTRLTPREHTGRFRGQSSLILLSFGRRSKAPELSVCLIRNDVERAVGALAHITNALLPLGQQMLFPHHTIVFEDQPDKSF